MGAPFTIQQIGKPGGSAPLVVHFPSLLDDLDDLVCSPSAALKAYFQSMTAILPLIFWVK